jgi:hypothetical protein
MIDGRDKGRSRRALGRTRHGLLIVVVVAVGGSVAVLAVRPDLLDVLRPAARRSPEQAGQLAERLSSTGSPFVSIVEIGRSVQGRPILGIRVGHGPRMVVVAGAIHGSEANTAVLVEDLAARLVDKVESLPRDASLFLVPRLNPDGLAKRSRYNAHGFDLNRNWDTNNRQSNPAGAPGDPPIVGGPSPFSEPETAAFSAWLRTVRDQSTARLSVILYHSAVPPSGLIQSGYRITGGQQQTDPNAAELGQYWSSQVGYEYSPTWPDYPITGEVIHWCAENRITCIDIELPTSDNLTEAEVQLHLTAIQGMIQK